MGVYCGQVWRSGAKMTSVNVWRVRQVCEGDEAGAQGEGEESKIERTKANHS